MSLYTVFICRVGNQDIPYPEGDSVDIFAQFHHLEKELAATQQICRSLFDRQATFEKQISAQLGKMQSYLEDLLVLSPGPQPSQLQPCKPAFTSTPQSASDDTNYKTDVDSPSCFPQHSTTPACQKLSTYVPGLARQL